MEEHLWTSSFWRLISNCSDSRKLLILQKIILHKLGNKAESLNNLNKIINNSLPPNNQESVRPELNFVNKVSTNKENKATKKHRPIMGTAALLAKRQNDEISDDSKIIAELVSAKFNKQYPPSVQRNEFCDEARNNEFNLNNMNVSELVEEDLGVSFDEERFLEEALGDEMNSFISAEFEDPRCEEQDLHQPRPTQLSISITSSRISSLISRASNIYTTLKERIHGTSKSSITESQPSICSLGLGNEVDLLLQEASIQHQIIIEACKALNVCLSSKEFLFKQEHIEAERILLLAMYKQNIILKEMKTFKYVKAMPSISIGYADVSLLKFPLTAKTQKEGYTNWLVAIVNCGRDAFITEAITIGANNTVLFPECFKFQNLYCDFEINVSIYSLLVKTSHEKHHLKQKETTCLSTPDKLFCRRNSIRYSKHYFERREPSFKLWGKACVNISDLGRSSPFHLQQMPTGTILKGVALMNFNTRVEFEGSCSDFLTLQTEGDNCMTWNLRWCCLAGSTLCYWNYPSDQDSIKPIGKIDLQYCKTSEISVAGRNLCARPRTLLIEAAESSNQCTVFVRHFLSADSTEKMEFWKNRINEILNELIKWNLMKCKI